MWCLRTNIYEKRFHCPFRITWIGLTFIIVGDDFVTIHPNIRTSEMTTVVSAMINRVTRNRCTCGTTFCELPTHADLASFAHGYTSLTGQCDLGRAIIFTVFPKFPIPRMTQRRHANQVRLTKRKL